MFGKVKEIIYTERQLLLEIEKNVINENFPLMILKENIFLDSPVSIITDNFKINISSGENSYLLISKKTLPIFKNPKDLNLEQIRSYVPEGKYKAKIKPINYITAILKGIDIIKPAMCMDEDELNFVFKNEEDEQVFLSIYSLSNMESDADLVPSFKFFNIKIEEIKEEV